MYGDESDPKGSVSLNQDNPDYCSLYLLEKKRNEDLKQEIQFYQAETKDIRRQLANIHEHAKKKRRDLAFSNEQLKEKQRDLALTYSQLEKFATDLGIINSNLKKTNLELQEAYRDTIHRLVLASEYKDNETGDHINRMCRYSTHLAIKIGLSRQEIEEIEFAAPMHDVGKIGIPDNIILKNGKLTNEEFDVIKTHTVIGAEILKSSKSDSLKSEPRILECAREIALFHHEKWNGRGYPEGRTKEEIPLIARIVAICDTFDALTSKRPYKNPYPIEVSCDIIRKEKGQHFDPDLVTAFLDNIDDFARIKREIDNTDKTETDFTWSERDKESIS
ncbi:MAG: HD-GYP domain-containing protein [Chitinispirillaceae bacterium]